LSRRKRKKVPVQPLEGITGKFRRYFLNSLLFITLSLILVSLSILILVVFEASEKKVATVIKAPPPEVQSALIKKMGKIITDKPRAEDIPSEIADYTEAESVLELIDKPHAKPAPETKPEETPVVQRPQPIPLPPEPEAHKPEPKPVPEVKPTPKPKPKPVPEADLPKLAIIIDDVSSELQMQQLLATHRRLNLSFFPPSVTSPETPHAAKKMNFFMIHLPLEAMNFNRPQENTLTVQSSSEEIERVIKGIRKDFPKARWINNHTGSRFTSDLEAMKRLMVVLKKYQFRFVDSVTIGRSKVKDAADYVGMPFLKRDIFLDNEPDVLYIKGQLKKAVEMAKRHGYAIAIGHPKRQTIEALQQAGEILKDVRLVYVKDL